MQVWAVICQNEIPVEVRLPLGKHNLCQATHCEEFKVLHNENLCCAIAKNDQKDGR